MGNPALVPGVTLNPKGNNGTNSHGYRAKNKAQAALSGAIELLGKRAVSPSTGVEELSRLIADKLQEDVVGTLHKLSTLMPKDINVAVQHTTSPLQLTDEQLQEIIDSRTKVINGECEEVKK